eukprot:6026866-Alexandrium_andersonii.AAC.1
MSRERKAYYEQEATKAKSEARAALDARVAEAQAALELRGQRAKEAEAAEAAGPMLLHACRWTAEDEQKIDELMGSARSGEAQ